MNLADMKKLAEEMVLEKLTESLKSTKGRFYGFDSAGELIDNFDKLSDETKDLFWKNMSERLRYVKPAREVWHPVSNPIEPHEQIPPERKVVAVWLRDKYLPFCGYIRFAAGDKESPYFVVYHGNPEIGADVIAWADCDIPVIDSKIAKSIMSPW